jgi:hypothetical protein
LVFEFKDYGLTDLPFVDLLTLQIYSEDQRENGRIYVNGETAQIEERILSRFKYGQLVTYVSSGGPAKGAGKSALMANVYWKLHDSNHAVVWTSAQGERSPGGLVGRIFDSIVSYGLGRKTNEKISAASKGLNAAKLRTIIGKKERPSLAKINGLLKVLQVDEPEQSAKLARIRQSIITYGPLDIFGYYLILLGELDVGRIAIFIDQFEDYVQAHTGGLQRLSDDWRTLLESLRGKASIIVTIHPEAEQKLRQLTNYRLAEVTPDSRIIVPELSPKKGVKLAAAYLAYSRTRGYKDTELSPFDTASIEYFTKLADGNPRKLMAALRTALILAKEQEVRSIDLKFAKSNAIRYSDHNRGHRV